MWIFTADPAENIYSSNYTKSLPISNLKNLVSPKADLVLYMRYFLARELDISNYPSLLILVYLEFSLTLASIEKWFPGPLLT